MSWKVLHEKFPCYICIKYYQKYSFCPCFSTIFCQPLFCISMQKHHLCALRSAECWMWKFCVENVILSARVGPGVSQYTTALKKKMTIILSFCHTVAVAEKNAPFHATFSTRTLAPFNLHSSRHRASVFRAFSPRELLRMRNRGYDLFALRKVRRAESGGCGKRAAGSLPAFIYLARLWFDKADEISPVGKRFSR